MPTIDMTATGKNITRMMKADLYFAMALLYHLLINFQKIINYMKFYQLTPMKIDKFQTIYEIIDVFVIFLLFRKYSLYIANKRYRGNYFFLLFLK